MWKALDAAGIAEVRQSMGAVALSPSGPYYEGDPRFWGFDLLEIDWDGNAARESVGDGAQAQGIQVPRADVLQLLPGGPRKKRKLGRQERRVLRHHVGH